MGVLRTSFFPPTYCPPFQDFRFPSISPALPWMFTQSCSEFSVEYLSCKALISIGQAFAGLHAVNTEAIKTFTYGYPWCLTFPTASITFAWTWSFKNDKWGLIHEVDSRWHHPERLFALDHLEGILCFYFSKKICNNMTEKSTSFVSKLPGSLNPKIITQKLY